MYGKKEEKHRITKGRKAVRLRGAAVAAAGFLAAAGSVGFAGLSGCGREKAVVLESASPFGEAGSSAADDGPESSLETVSGTVSSEPAMSEAALSEFAISETVTAELIQVHVCGAVKEPGVYGLPAGSRVFEAVEAAGGMAGEAAADYLNLADPVFDGAKVRVPFFSELSGEELYGPSGSFGVTGGRAADGSGPDASGSAGLTSGQDGFAAAGTDGRTDGLVDLNHADKTVLMGLPGIGEAKAEAIISWREEHGSFGVPEDIMQVPGIKQAAYEKLKDKITVR
ncbi:MAG: alkaline serine protease [Lachnospiraceae bacterium]|jgi:competence protein ComEA|nr:alkaline serine protease [Lachnospiraceae bacterium]